MGILIGNRSALTSALAALCSKDPPPFSPTDRSYGLDSAVVPSFETVAGENLACRIALLMDFDRMIGPNSNLVAARESWLTIVAEHDTLIAATSEPAAQHADIWD